jgi:hypothetical protein
MGLIAGIAMVMVVIGVLAALLLLQKNTALSASAVKTATVQAEYTPVAGVQIGPIKCSYAEMTLAGFYHEHAHLAIFDHGRNVPIDSNIGYDLQHDCLTWTHTHSPSLGIIHVESPYKIVPTLGEFFKVWGKPLNSHQVASATVNPGDKMRVYVGTKLYTGDPTQIKLVRHENITIEVGPPFEKPVLFNFAKYNL